MVLVLVAVTALAGCGEPLAALPDDATAVVYLETFVEPQRGGFANLRLDTSTCLQLAEGTTVTLNDVPADDVSVGGRGNNPLAAYVDFGCQQPSASWFALDDVEAPFVFRVASGDVSLELELDEERQVSRCDFPSCVSEGPVAPPAPPEEG